MMGGKHATEKKNKNKVTTHLIIRNMKQEEFQDQVFKELKMNEEIKIVTV